MLPHTNIVRTSFPPQHPSHTITVFPACLAHRKAVWPACLPQHNSSLHQLLSPQHVWCTLASSPHTAHILPSQEFQLGGKSEHHPMCPRLAPSWLALLWLVVLWLAPLWLAPLWYQASTLVARTLVVARTLAARTLCCAHTMIPIKAIVRTLNNNNG